MIVAVVTVRVVHAPRDQVVDVIAMRHRLVPAPGAVRVIRYTVGRPGVTIRMICIHRDHMLIDVIAVRMVKVAVVEIVDVIVMTHRDVTTSFSVDVCVISFMNRM